MVFQTTVSDWRSSSSLQQILKLAASLKLRSPFREASLKPVCQPSQVASQCLVLTRMWCMARFTIMLEDTASEILLSTLQSADLDSGKLCQLWQLPPAGLQMIRCSSGTSAADASNRKRGSSAHVYSSLRQKRCCTGQKRSRGKGSAWLEQNVTVALL